MFRADLHCHTTCSDGSLTPEELVRLAVDIGLSGLSITDHDTVKAYEIATPLAKELGLELLPGIEFSAENSVHILGYGFNLEDKNLLNFCDRHVQRREERNRHILEKLSEHGMPVTEEEMKSFGERVYGRPHIAQVMMSKGYIKNVDEAFHKWIGEGKPAYAPGRQVSVQDTIDTIHQAGGKAIIAHPHVMRNEQLLQRLLQMPFDGIEGYYSLFRPKKEQRFVNMGKERGWIVTGGSDFHGAAKPDIKLGCSWVTEDVFRELEKVG